MLDKEILDDGLDEIIIGYAEKEYTLRELRETANYYKSSDPNIDKTKEKHSKIYNYPEQIIPYEILKNTYNLDENFKEIWRPVPLETKLKYCVSNLGRIAVDFGNNKREILIQDDISGKKGYLIISYENTAKNLGKLNHSICIYQFIAHAFLMHTSDDYTKHIHHIDNNGYDCRPENLILLTPRQHSKVHGFFVSGDNVLN